MTLFISTTARNAATDAVVDLLDAGGAGSIEIRTGTQPADPGTAATGTLLVTLALSATAYGASVTGTATLNAVTSGTAVASGTAGWFRAKSGAGTAIFDGAVGTTGAELNLNSTAVISGGSVGVNSGSFTTPA